MKICITQGTGKGQTKMAAFDAALWSAGIADFNLIKLSSIIPPKSSIEVRKADIEKEDNLGKKLYLVLSEKRESEIGREAWAGLGWVQAGDGRGIFVEQEGASEKEVIRLIEETLSDMTRYRSGNFGKIRNQVIGVRCEDRPVCALVAAVYQIEDWAPTSVLKACPDIKESPATLHKK